MNIYIKDPFGDTNNFAIAINGLTTNVESLGIRALIGNKKMDRGNIRVNGRLIICVTIRYFMAVP